MSLCEDLDAATVSRLPQHLVDMLKALPCNVDRQTAADLITRNFFPCSRRTLEAWPLPVRRVNGHAIHPTAAVFAVAYDKLSAAPVIMRPARKPYQPAERHRPQPAAA
jgi:hypothetical protein